MPPPQHPLWQPALTFIGWAPTQGGPQMTVGLASDARRAHIPCLAYKTPKCTHYAQTPKCCSYSTGGFHQPPPRTTTWRRLLEPIWLFGPLFSVVKELCLRKGGCQVAGTPAKFIRPCQVIWSGGFTGDCLYVSAFPSCPEMGYPKPVFQFWFRPGHGVICPFTKSKLLTKQVLFGLKFWI